MQFGFVPDGKDPYLPLNCRERAGASVVGAKGPDQCRGEGMGQGFLWGQRYWVQPLAQGQHGHMVAGWHRVLIYSGRALNLALDLKCVVA